MFYGEDRVKNSNTMHNAIKFNTSTNCSLQNDLTKTEQLIM